MVSLTVLFYILIGMFAIIGSTRGRTKEFLVTLSAVVAIFCNAILEQFIPGYMEYLTHDSAAMLFYVRGGIVFVIVILGYLTPKLPQIFVNQNPLGKLKDAFWGLFFGAINGYLIVGSIWSYMHDASYPIPSITAPDATTAFGKTALSMISALPPHIFTPPGIYFVVAVAFVIILGAFV
jgi:uncharacterized membrane protein required for colicin V production